jgi:E3 ubiquitin-protein ligase ATL41
MGSDIEDDDYGNKFGVSSKIMYAAIFSLFAVVVLIIILHIYARYLLRRQERRQRAALYRATSTTQVAPDETHQYPTSGPQGKGLDPSVIASLPKFIHKPSDHFEAIECSICLSTVGEEATVRLLPNCKHMFHVECVDIWLSSNTTCPICRTVAEPRVHPVQPTAPPVEDSMPLPHGGAESGGSRLSSFRRMLSRERSSRRIQSCGDDDQVGAEDLERQ